MLNLVRTILENVPIKSSCIVHLNEYLHNYKQYTPSFLVFLVVCAYNFVSVSCQYFLEPTSVFVCLSVQFPKMSWYGLVILINEEYYKILFSVFLSPLDLPP